jgi:DNA polymerase-3 subunit alpha/error-prone DNA polymerase
MAAVISNQGGYYSVFAYVSEARRLGLTIQPPDIQKSSACWTGKGQSLRVGLQAIKQLSSATRARIIRERRQSPFTTFENFLNRTMPAEPEIRALIHCGAVDSLNPDPDRTSLLWRFAGWQHTRHKKYPQNIFEGPALPPTPVLPATDTITRLRREFAILGFLVQYHPMELYRHALSGAHIIQAKKLPLHVGKKVTCAGWLITGKTVRTKHGDAMEFLTFEDETGLYETTFFPQIYSTFCHLLEVGRPFLLTGKVEEDYGAITLTVTHVSKLQPSVRLETTISVGHRLKAVGERLKETLK